MPTKRT